MIFEALMAVAGAGYGVYQADKRSDDLKAELARADLIYEATKKKNRAEQSLLENNLTIGAMDNTANNRDSSIAEYQNRSMQEAQAGVSGVSSGTPFFNIDAEAIANRKKLDEIRISGAFGLDTGVKQLNASLASSNAGMQDALFNLQDIGSQSAYASSPFAYIMGGLTGALSGAAMGNQISTLTKDVFGVTVDEAFGGLGVTVDEAFGGLVAYNEAMDLAKTGGIPLDTAQRKVSDTALSGGGRTYTGTSSRERPGPTSFMSSIFQPTTFGDRFTSRHRTPVDYFRIDSNMAVPFMGTRSSGLSLASLYPSAMGIKYPGIPSMNTSQSSPFPTLGGTN